MKGGDRQSPALRGAVDAGERGMAGPGLRARGPRGDLWVVVLAGGNGKRLQAFTRGVLGTERPKQFCRIIGTRSMLRHTWDRAARLVAPERMLTIITAGQEGYLEDEAGHGVPGTILVQPENKETAPGLLLPLLWIARRNPVATVAVFPADHFIWEEDRFEAHMRAAVGAAARLRRRLILLGVEADAPETGYGWIAPGDPVQTPSGAELHLVRRFWEKPDRPTAAHLLACGYFWNTFILVGGVDTFLALVRTAVPEVFRPLRAIASCLGTPAEPAALSLAYQHLRATNLSQALLARHPEALMVQVARGISWCDWGDPERILRSLRRFDRQPAWLPVYARTRAAAAVTRPGPVPHRKEENHAAA